MTASRRGRFALVIAALAIAACGEDPTVPALEITTTILPDGREGQPYSAAVDAEGGPSGEYEWAVLEGFLPTGLSLSVEDLSADEDLLVTGTPTRESTYTFTLQVTDGGKKATRQFTVQIGPPLVNIENLVLPPALQGSPYDVPLRATGGLEAHEFSIVSGTLPAGLSLTAAGHIQGTPTATDTAQITIQVTSGDETDQVTFDLAVIANRAGYQITPVFVAETPSSILLYVEQAIAMWEDVITGDLPSDFIPPTFFPSRGCGGFGQQTNGTSVEDVLVIVNIDSIDGPGQVLGQAGPCGIRATATEVTNLTVVGILTLDSEDLAPMGSGALDVIAHEIGHVLGFGGLWDEFIEGDGTLDPRFTGANGVEEWQALGGTGTVPVEGTGGEGTAGSHWRESTFKNELMTGFISSGLNPLSRVTIGAFEDLGYAVDYAAADPYLLTLMQGGVEDGGRILGYDVVLQEQPRPVAPDRGPIQTPQRDR